MTNTNGFDLGGLYDTILNILWEDAIEKLPCEYSQLCLYEFTKDDMEKQAIDILRG